MISNERPSPYGNRGFGAPKPHVNEDTLRSGTVQIERKTFVFTLKENPRGRFLRITEDVGGRRDAIIIPAPGQREAAAKSFRVWEGLFQGFNVLMIAGVAVYFWRAAHPAEQLRFVGSAKIRG